MDWSNYYDLEIPFDVNGLIHNVRLIPMGTLNPRCDGMAVVLFEPIAHATNKAHIIFASPYETDPKFELQSRTLSPYTQRVSDGKRN